MPDEASLNLLIYRSVESALAVLGSTPKITEQAKVSCITEFVEERVRKHSAGLRFREVEALEKIANALVSLTETYYARG